MSQIFKLFDIKVKDFTEVLKRKIKFSNANENPTQNDAVIELLKKVETMNL